MRIVTLLFAILLCSASSAGADVLFRFGYGSHEDRDGDSRPVVSLDARYRAGTPVSVGLGGAWMDDSGGAPAYTQYRIEAGADYHFGGWCLLPLEIVPGFGVEYVLRRGGPDPDEAVGVFGHALGMVTLFPALSAGGRFRIGWNSMTSRSEELAVVVQVRL